jgi:membrane protease YdiL (CAAX protease family)
MRNNNNTEPNSNKDKKQSIVEKYKIPPFLFGMLAVLAIAVVSYNLTAGLLIYFFVDDSLRELSPKYDRIITPAAQLIFLLLPTLLFARLLPDKFKVIFKLNKISFVLCVWIVISVFALIPMCEIIVALQSQMPMPGFIEAYIQEFNTLMETGYKRATYFDTLSEFGLVILVFAVVPSFCQEFFFRGLLQHCFTTGWDARHGIFYAGMFYAMLHFNPYSFFGILVLGFYFSFLLYKTGSIVAPIIAHFTNNVIAINLPYVLGRNDFIPENADMVFTLNEVITLFLIFAVSLGLFLLSLFMIFGTREPEITR